MKARPKWWAEARKMRDEGKTKCQPRKAQKREGTLNASPFYHPQRHSVRYAVFCGGDSSDLVRRRDNFSCGRRRTDVGRKSKNAPPGQSDAF